jgi:hypothetical protein
MTKSLSGAGHARDDRDGGRDLGWIKTVVMRKTRHRGLARVSWITFKAAVYNMLQIRTSGGRYLQAGKNGF